MKLAEFFIEARRSYLLAHGTFTGLLLLRLAQGDWAWAATYLVGVSLITLLILEQITADRRLKLANFLHSAVVEAMQAGMVWQSQAKIHEAVLEMNKDLVGVAHLIVNGKGPRADR